MFRAGVFVLALASASASAWPFGEESESRPREKRAGVFSAERSTAFQNLVSQRTARDQEKAVVDRLVAEKKGELAAFDERLSRFYGMSADRTYVYEATNRTIYLVLEKDGAPRRLAHRTFPTAEESDAFLDLLEAKRMTLRQIEVFGEVSREKKAESELISRQLLKDFEVRPDVRYRYDAETRTLWEIVPPPPPKPKPDPVAEKKAKVAAEAAAKAKKEEERAKARAAIEAAEAKAKADKLAKKEAEEKARAAAVEKEKAALAAAIEKAKGDREASRDQAARALAAAETREAAFRAAIAEAEAKAEKAKNDKQVSSTALNLFREKIATAKGRLEEASQSVKAARRALADAEDALSRAEKDAIKDFYDDLRSRGKKPLTEPSGFFSWF